MFNLIVSGNGDSWEKEPFTMDRSRFGEYSGDDAAEISLKEPKTLETLVGLPTLLMYEVGAQGENARLVRFGKLISVRMNDRRLQFGFERNVQHGFMTRGAIQEFANQLGMHRFEDYRTHWAVKDGDIPSELIQRGLPEPPVRDIAIVSREYAEALSKSDNAKCKLLKAEIGEMPPSLDKAREYLRRTTVEFDFLEPLRHLGTTPHEGRAKLQAALAEDLS